MQSLSQRTVVSYWRKVNIQSFLPSFLLTKVLPPLSLIASKSPLDNGALGR